MRISDWRSDVCSSDLRKLDHETIGVDGDDFAVLAADIDNETRLGYHRNRTAGVTGDLGVVLFRDVEHAPAVAGAHGPDHVGLGQPGVTQRIGNGCHDPLPTDRAHMSDVRGDDARSEEHPSELQSLMRISSAVS